MNYDCLLLFSVFIALSLCVCLCEYMTYMCDGEVFNVLHIGHNITLAGRGRLKYTKRFLIMFISFVILQMKCINTSTVQITDKFFHLSKTKIPLHYHILAWTSVLFWLHLVQQDTILEVMKCFVPPQTEIL